MKDGQRKKNNKYILPQQVWLQTINLIRDYYRMKEVADDLIATAPVKDGTGIRSGVSDPTFAKVVKRERHVKMTDIIDEEKNKIPVEYRHGVWNSIMYRTPYPLDADRSTYSRWKSRFVYNVAVCANIY